MTVKVEARKQVILSMSEEEASVFLKALDSINHRCCPVVQAVSDGIEALDIEPSTDVVFHYNPDSQMFDMGGGR